MLYLYREYLTIGVGNDQVPCGTPRNCSHGLTEKPKLISVRCPIEQQSDPECLSMLPAG